MNLLNLLSKILSFFLEPALIRLFTPYLIHTVKTVLTKITEHFNIGNQLVDYTHDMKHLTS